MGMKDVSLSQIATSIGLLGSFAGIVTTWHLTQYRLDQIEASIEKISSDTESLEQASEEQAAEVKCLICQTHNIPCPGC
jgi:methyl-accepting chemotaxis protein